MKKTPLIVVCLSFMVLIMAFAGTKRGVAHIGDIQAPAKTYDSCKNYVQKAQARLKPAYAGKRISLDSIGKVHTDLMVQHIFPHWYGTAWDFNGYTDKPGEGTVACGYFVSTTLKHSGIKLNRYKMAQKSSMDGALMLEPKDSLLIVRGTVKAFLPVFEKKCKDGLYMVGLSFHVGFLYKSGSDVYFIHSSYLAPVCVVKEKAAESAALAQSSIFVVADITYNHKLMKKWMNGEELKY